MRPIMADRARPSATRSGPEIDDPIILCSLGGEHAVQPGPTVCLDLGVHISTDLEVASRPELESGDMRSAGAHAPADVVAGDHEVAAVVGFPAHDDMDVGTIGVPVVDADPIESRAEIPLGLRHHIPREGSEIGELLRILRGHDEAEMVAIASATIGKGAMVSVVLFGAEHSDRSAVLRYAFPPQVSEMSPERSPLRPVPYHAGLDGAARSIRHQASGCDAGRPAAAEAGVPGGPPGSTMQTAGLLGCRQCLRDERLGATGATPVPDASKPDPKIIVTSHDVDASEVRAISLFQGVA